MLRIRSRIRNLLCDRSGSPTTEFALIAPLFLTMMLGSFSAFDATRGLKQTSRTAFIISDLSTRVLSFDDETRDAMLGTANSLMGKYAENSDFTIIITSVVNTLGDETDDLTVAWSVTNIEDEELDTEDLEGVEFPTIPDGESVIYVIASADYDPLFDYFTFSEFKLQKSSIRRPRFVREVLYEN